MNISSNSFVSMQCRFFSLTAERTWCRVWWLLLRREKQFSPGWICESLRPHHSVCAVRPGCCFSDWLCTLNREWLWRRPEERLYVRRQRLRITQHAAQLRNSDRQQTNPAFMSCIRCRVTDSCSDWPDDILSFLSPDTQRFNVALHPAANTRLAVVSRQWGVFKASSAGFLFFSSKLASLRVSRQHI